LTSFNKLLLINTSTVFLNLCDVWNIIQQGTVGYEDRFAATCVLSLVAESFEKRLIFREVIDMSKVSCFFDSQYISTSIASQSCLVIWSILPSTEKHFLFRQAQGRALATAQTIEFARYKFSKWIVLGLPIERLILPLTIKEF